MSSFDKLRRQETRSRSVGNCAHFSPVQACSSFGCGVTTPGQSFDIEHCRRCLTSNWQALHSVHVHVSPEHPEPPPDDGDDDGEMFGCDGGGELPPPPAPSANTVEIKKILAAKAVKAVNAVEFLKCNFIYRLIITAVAVIGNVMRRGPRRVQRSLFRQRCGLEKVS